MSRSDPHTRPAPADCAAAASGPHTCLAIAWLGAPRPKCVCPVTAINQFLFGTRMDCLHPRQQIKSGHCQQAFEQTWLRWWHWQVRTAILRLLLQLNFFVEDRKDQLKKSRLGGPARPFPTLFVLYPPASAQFSAVTVLQRGCSTALSKWARHVVPRIRSVQPYFQQAVRSSLLP